MCGTIDVKVLDLDKTLPASIVQKLEIQFISYLSFLSNALATRHFPYLNAPRVALAPPVVGSVLE